MELSIAGALKPIMMSPDVVGQSQVVVITHIMSQTPEGGFFFSFFIDLQPPGK